MLLILETSVKKIKHYFLLEEITFDQRTKKKNKTKV